ncbi:hypothetical protein SAMN05444161_0584 [Rhizobiales bacterium GAS191]|nr:hypothetical protein SAMN05444161_0584 [Rhizobiales bacterium GAS191]
MASSLAWRAKLFNRIAASAVFAAPCGSSAKCHGLCASHVDNFAVLVSITLLLKGFQRVRNTTGCAAR